MRPFLRRLAITCLLGTLWQGASVVGAATVGGGASTGGASTGDPECAVYRDWQPPPPVGGVTVDKVRKNTGNCIELEISKTGLALPSFWFFMERDYHTLKDQLKELCEQHFCHSGGTCPSCGSPELVPCEFEGGITEGGPKMPFMGRLPKAKRVGPFTIKAYGVMVACCTCPRAVAVEDDESVNVEDQSGGTVATTVLTESRIEAAEFEHAIRVKILDEKTGETIADMPLSVFKVWQATLPEEHMTDEEP